MSYVYSRPTDDLVMAAAESIDGQVDAAGYVMAVTGWVPESSSSWLVCLTTLCTHPETGHTFESYAMIRAQDLA
jgi:hypothetical protein